MTGAFRHSDSPHYESIPPVTADMWQAHRALTALARQLKCKPDEVEPRVEKLLEKSRRGDQRAEKILNKLRVGMHAGFHGDTDCKGG